ncbi:phenylalanine--tRNA ligase subunit alpha [Gammaproteobacteria bacterium]|jgi:phenylalanyl-tRNA synthetase alpha chain|nr:phenylalanine--tRNA ligase subunit alpha [Gammaproteobacteria bacterium]|tara:strand:+ start:2776 stop:3768 length:993 start_codon:yes stop_codon:yes gene_type:complete
MQIPQDLIDTAKFKLKSVQSEAEFFQLRAQFLGKKSYVISAFTNLKSLEAKEKILAAKELNILKEKLSTIFEEALEVIQNIDATSVLDVTLPADPYLVGAEHPISIVEQRVISYFSSLNYQVFSGEEIETDYFNFEALNFPKNHPARQMHDTFYLKSKSKSEYLLRTHTSNSQIHAMNSMSKEDLPLYMLSPGRVYRCDSDTTHLPMFTQIEGLVVDVDVTFGDLKGVIINFLEDFFGKKMEVRFRPSYFPFTEPSAEVDIKFGDNGWLEILGCGMVHPNVLTNCNINTKKYRGFAFGMGIERLAMLRYGVQDIREFYSSNLDFLNQFTS